MTETVYLHKTGATGTNISASVELPMERIFDALGLPSTVYSKLKPGANEPASLRLRALNADGTESDNRLLTSQYYWGFDAEGNVIRGTVASTSYVLTLNFANGRIAVNGYRTRLTIGTTYQAAVALIYTNSDGKEYTATIRLNIAVD